MITRAQILCCLCAVVALIAAWAAHDPYLAGMGTGFACAVVVARGS